MNKKHPKDIELPDSLLIPDGRFVVNFSDIKTRCKVFIATHKEDLPLEELVKILLESKQPFRTGVKQKHCKKCKGSIFDKVEEKEIDVFIFVSWECMNCGQFSPSRYFSDTFKAGLEKKEKEIDTDIVSTLLGEEEE